jgi:hypothetical protein
MTQHKNPCPAGYFNAYGAKARHPCLAVLVSAHDVVGAPPAFAGACFAHHDGIKRRRPNWSGYFQAFSMPGRLAGRQSNPHGVRRPGVMMLQRLSRYVPRPAARSDPAATNHARMSTDR